MSNRHRRRLHRARFHRRTPPGAQPGMVVVDPAASKPVVHVMAYGPAGLVEQPIEDLKELPPLVAKHSVVWVNVDGLGDAALLQKLGETFSLHRLALEDAVNLHQRAKVDNYGEHLFVVARMVKPDEHFHTEQVSLFLGKNFVLTLTEDPGDCFDAVRGRLRAAAGSIRRGGPDYLAYAILDAIVDQYFPALEKLGDRLDALEDRVFNPHGYTTIAQIHETKHELLSARRAIWPHREAINYLCHDHSGLVGSETQVYLRDCNDHVVQLVELLEMYRELAADLRDAYLSNLSNRMNEVMRVLTVISTIFIPLTFITSIYGMNFNTKASRWNMPELEWPFGYALVWASIVSVSVAMLAFFWKRGWLRSLTPSGSRDLGAAPPQGPADGVVAEDKQQAV